MVKASGVLGGPLVAFEAGFLSYLDECGYSIRAAGERVDLLRQLSLWLAARGLSAAELTAAEAQRFFATRRAAGQRRVPTLRMLVPLFDYLRDERVVPAERLRTTQLDDLLARYGQYLEHDRGVGRWASGFRSPSRCQLSVGWPGSRRQACAADRQSACDGL